jgi:hypothetical protein
VYNLEYGVEETDDFRAPDPKRLASRSVKDEDSVMSASETEGRDVRIAISVRATSQSLGWIETEAGIFQRLGLNVMFPAMETAAVEGVAGLGLAERLYGG